MNPNELPYRFSFYSNAFPTTIHARTLAELPEDGQSFEDLFNGRPSRQSSTHTTHVHHPQQPRSDLPTHPAQEPPILDRALDVLDSSSVLRSPPTMILSPDSKGLTVSSSPDRVDELASPTLIKDLSENLGLSAFDPLVTQRPPSSTSHPQPVNLLKKTDDEPRSVQLQEDRSRDRVVGPIGSVDRNTADAPLGLDGNHRHLPDRQPRSGELLRTEVDSEANTWWLDILSPTDQEMKVLSKVFGIHPLTKEDIEMEEAREKIELFRNYYLVCFRSFDQDPYSPTYLEPLNIYIIVFREGTLSFHFRGTPHPHNVRRRIKQLKDYINVTSDWISYALIDDITDAFGPLIQSIDHEVDSIDELVLILRDAEQSDMLRRIGTCRKKVMGLLRLMGNKADVVKGLSKRCNENWLIAPKSDIGLYLSDIQDHLVTMTQNLNHYEKILSRSHSNYLAQISIEMTEANNQINDVLSKLTALGSILVPMNLVTGLWGMNVHVPGQDVTEGYAWFISIVCSLVSFGVVGAWLTLRYFNKS